ncbi:hypothetical protein GCM10027287_08480 [Bordetella muralis]
MRELTLHEISSAGGASALGPAVGGSEGMYIASAAVGSVATTAGYVVGASLMGPVARVGIVKAMAYGGVLPFFADLYLAGSDTSTRMGRSALLGAASGLIASISHYEDQVVTAAYFSQQSHNTPMLGR